MQAMHGACADIVKIRAGAGAGADPYKPCMRHACADIVKIRAGAGVMI